MSTVSTTWCVGTQPGAPNLAELLGQDFQREEPPTELPKMVLQVTLLQPGSNQVLRTDCDVTSRSTVRTFCRSLQTWTLRGKRALAGLTCHSARSVPCKGVSGGTAAQKCLRPQAGHVLLFKVVPNTFVPC